jgi:hypothetical protein
VITPPELDTLMKVLPVTLFSRPNPATTIARETARAIRPTIAHFPDNFMP